MNFKIEKTTPEEQKRSRRVSTIQNRSSLSKLPTPKKSSGTPINHEVEDESDVKDMKEPQKSDLSSTLNQVMRRVKRPGSGSSISKEESKSVINKDVDTLLRTWGLIVGDNIKIKEDVNTKESEVIDESLLKEKSRAREIRNKIAWESWYAKKKEAAKREEEFERKGVQEKHKHEDVEKKPKHYGKELSSYKRWLFGNLEREAETDVAAEKSQNTAEENKIVIEKRREQRKVEFEQALEACVGKKRNRHLEERPLKEGAVQQLTPGEKEHREQCQKAFEEWKLKSANKPKPMFGKIYDPQAHCRITSNMFINPNPWTRDF